MSSVKGAQKTLFDAGTILKPGLFDGRVKCLVDTYEAATLANPSTITMSNKLTKGAIVLAVLLVHDALGGSVTLDVGDAESTVRYLSAVDVSSLGSTISDLADGVAYETDETDTSNLDTQVLVTVGGSGTATGTIKLIVLYTND